MRSIKDWEVLLPITDILIGRLYRFSRRESDYCLECSVDGVTFKQMRICHMWEGADEITFGIYACSPEQSSFKAVFTNMEVTECKWQAHC